MPSVPSCPFASLTTESLYTLFPTVNNPKPCSPKTYCLCISTSLRSQYRPLRQCQTFNIRNVLLLLLLISFIYIKLPFVGRDRATESPRYASEQLASAFYLHLHQSVRKIFDYIYTLPIQRECTIQPSYMYCMVLHGVCWNRLYTPYINVLLVSQEYIILFMLCYIYTYIYWSPLVQLLQCGSY